MLPILLKRVWLTSTPFSKSGYFFEACQNAKPANPDGMWTEFHVKSTDSPLVQEDPAFIEEIKKLTRDEYVQEVEGDYTLKVGKGNPPFEWAEPDEWNAVEGTAMRIANFNFGPDKKGECYFTVLPGGGQLLANLNRWRGQMGLPDATQQEADALPSRQFLFGEGKYVEIEGSFKGFGASDVKDGYKMIGIIMPELQIGGPK